MDDERARASGLLPGNVKRKRSGVRSRGRARIERNQPATTQRRSESLERPSRRDHSLDTATDIRSPGHWDFEAPAKSQTRKQPPATTGIERVRHTVELPFLQVLREPDRRTTTP